MCYPYHRGPGGPFGRHGFGPGPFGQGRRGPRVPRGRLRTEILKLLAEGPKHGYELMNLITERSGGLWQPSPGSVYPTLQLLEDQGLVVGETDGDRRVYRLTEAGQEEASRLAEQPDEPLRGPMAGRIGPEVAQIMQALRTIALTGTSQQRETAQEALAELRRRLYQILAE